MGTLTPSRMSVHHPGLSEWAVQPSPHVVYANGRSMGRKDWAVRPAQKLCLTNWRQCRALANSHVRAGLERKDGAFVATNTDFWVFSSQKGRQTGVTNNANEAGMLTGLDCLYPVQLQREHAKILRDLTSPLFPLPTGNNTSQVGTRLCLWIPFQTPEGCLRHPPRSPSPRGRYQ